MKKQAEEINIETTEERITDYSIISLDLPIPIPVEQAARLPVIVRPGELGDLLLPDRPGFDVPGFQGSHSGSPASIQTFEIMRRWPPPLGRFPPIGSARRGARRMPGRPGDISPLDRAFDESVTV
jgi:hypothetical protein